MKIGTFIFGDGIELRIAEAGRNWPADSWQADRNG